MRGVKQIHLPFMFQYSKDGKYEDECVVTIQAPGLDQIAVHSKMVAFAAASMAKAEEERIRMIGTLGSALDTFIKANEDRRAAREDDEVKAVSDEDKAAQAMSLFAAGLGDEKFPAFVDFLKKSLTANVKLARIGDTKLPLNDAIWNSIDEKGGMDAVNFILGSFVSFFLKGEPFESHATSGNSSQPTSPSQVAVH